MTIDHIKIEHSCNVIRREIENEFRDLQLLFIVHKDNERLNAVKSKLSAIRAMDGAQPIVSILKNRGKGNESQLIGLAKETPTGLTKFYMPTRYTAVIFINQDSLNLKLNVKEPLYHQVWHALNLLEEHKNETQGCTVVDDAIIPVHTHLTLAHNNLKADVFSAIMMQSQGHEEYIFKMAQRRIEETLTPIPGHNPELFPFPITAEACELIYHDLGDIPSYRNKPLSHAFQMAKEIALTYEKTSIGQWQDFCAPALEMAWMGYKPKDILGTALYTSEDAYVRATAHMISEVIDIEPEVITNLGTYNPYLQTAENEQLHATRYIEVIQYVMQKAKEKQDPAFFLKAAEAQNKKFLKGQSCGWCADALIKAYNAYHNNIHQPDIAEKQAETAFHEAQTSLNWTTIISASQMIMRARRDKHDMGISNAIQLLENFDEYAPIALAFKFTEELALAAYVQTHGAEPTDNTVEIHTETQSYSDTQSEAHV